MKERISKARTPRDAQICLAPTQQQASSYPCIPNIPISQCHSFNLLEIEAINALKMCALEEQEGFGERLGMSRKLP